jgi:hypothetical protein
MGKGLKPLVSADRYPVVLPEETTLDLVLSGFSCARFGDGELRLALEGTAVSQKAEKGLQRELRQLLQGPTKSIVCIPHYKDGPKAENWKKYGQLKFVLMMQQLQYGSAFISRPDSAPWINKPTYWEKVQMLWVDRDVTLVVGTDATSLNQHMLRKAKSVRVVVGPRRDAYSVIDDIEKEIGVPSDGQPIILCLGATATVLAERLARKGCWAIDFGHVGKFMPQEWR